MSRKLTIKITFGCGKVVLIKCNSKKKLDGELKRLSRGMAIWDGLKYTKDYKLERVK